MGAKRTKFQMWTLKDLCRQIQVDDKIIKDLIRELGSNETNLYKSSEIPKKNGGVRVIDNPRDKLKFVQRQINDNILQRTRIHEAACGGVKGKRLREFLEVHCGKPMVMTSDMKDFFPNTKQNNICRMFCNLGMAPEIAKILTSLTTFKGRLPQGAPTSPMIANIIAGYGANSLDARIDGVCKSQGAVHKRWVDDIVISGPSHLPKVKPTVRKIVKQCGFIINEKKEENAIHTRDEAQIVTGHSVNVKPNTPKSVRKKLRAEIHRLRLGNFEGVTKRTKNSLRGRIAHVESIDPETGGKFLSDFEKIFWPKSILSK